MYKKKLKFNLRLSSFSTNSFFGHFRDKSTFEKREYSV